MAIVKRFVFDVVDLLTEAPEGAELLRAVRSRPLNGEDAGAPYTTEWFAVPDGSLRSETWLAGSERRAGIILASEVIQRGDDWLRDRWTMGGTRWKHVALARRAPGISAADFSMRWQGKAGTAKIGQATSPVRIPDEARGCAYVQNHPLPRPGGDWDYDAITEVWFDDAGGLQRRAEWFGGNPNADPLFSDTRLFSVVEEVVQL